MPWSPRLGHQLICPCAIFSCPAGFQDSFLELGRGPCLRGFPGAGVLPWGSRSLSGSRPCPCCPSVAPQSVQGFEGKAIDSPPSSQSICVRLPMTEPCPAPWPLGGGRVRGRRCFRALYPGCLAGGGRSRRPDFLWPRDYYTSSNNVSLSKDCESWGGFLHWKNYASFN